MVAESPTSGDCLLSPNGVIGGSLSLQGAVPLRLHGRKEPAETASPSEKSRLILAPVGAQDVARTTETDYSLI